MARSFRVTALSLFLLVCFMIFCPAALALRVISLYPGHSDNIAALGGAGMLVGLSENDDHDLLPDLPRFSMKTGAEALLVLSPDVVLVRSLNQRTNPNLIPVLERAGVKVESIEPPSWEGFADYLRRLADVLALDPEAGVLRLEEIRRSIEAEAKAARGDGRSPRVFLEATARELHTCAPESWAARLIALAGGENVAAGAEPLRKDSPLAPWGMERVLKLAANGLDVYIVQQGAMNAATLNDVRARPWAAALKDTRLAAVPENCLSRPSLPGLERGGRLLIEVFYGKVEK